MTRQRAKKNQPGFRMTGTLTLREPAAYGTTEGAARQYDLVTERQLEFTVNVPDGRTINTEAGPIILGREVTVQVHVRGHAILDGFPETGTPTAALTHPAVQAGHSAYVQIYPGQAHLSSVPETLPIFTASTNKSLAQDGLVDSFLAYDLDGKKTQERMDRARRLIGLNELERDRLAYLSELVALHIMNLDDYRAARGHGFDESVLARVDRTRNILRWHLDYRAWEDPALYKYRQAILALFMTSGEARSAAWMSRPRAKRLHEHVKDAAMVVPHVAETVGAGLAETGRMARDLGTLTADVFGEKTGLYDIAWEPLSAVGQAYAAGKGTADIAWSVVDGISTAVDSALYAAEHGDYRPLMNLSGELAVELLLARGLFRAARAKRGSRAGKVSVGKRVARRYQRVLARARTVRARLARARNLPGRVKDELDALAAALGQSIQPQQVTAAAGAPLGLINGLDRLRQVYASARLEKSSARVLATLDSRRALSKRDKTYARTVIARFEQVATASTARRASTSVLTYIESLPAPTAFLRALDSTLAVSGRFAPDDFVALQARATRAAHPAAYLDDIRWLSRLDGKARSALSPVLARGEVDLTWLRSAGLADRDVALLALAPDTDWAHLQRQALLADGLPEEVKAVIGKRIAELREAPPGTVFWAPRDRQKQLRWRPGQGTGRPSLTVDSKGTIVLGGADDLNRAALGRNMRKNEPKFQGHHDHHIVPIAVAREHELFRLARTKGSWDPNHPDNGIQLPANKKARDARQASHGLPIHNSSHGRYSQEVEQLAEDAARALRNEYGTLDEIPAGALTNTAEVIVRQARAMLLRWPSEKGPRLQ